MSVLSEHREQQSTAALSRLELPRVNLLPPEIGERVRFRRIQYGLGLGVLGALGVVVLLVAVASGNVDSANQDLDASNTTAADLKQQTDSYAGVNAVYAKAATAKAQLTQAMGQEVRYSQLLNDMSLSVPENVWVTNITFAQTDGTAPAAAATAVAGDPGIGTVAFNGTAFSHDDVAVWLDALAKQKGYANPYFSSSTEKLIGTKKAVEFDSTVTLTPAALSGRFTAPAGG